MAKAPLLKNKAGTFLQDAFSGMYNPDPSAGLFSIDDTPGSYKNWMYRSGNIGDSEDTRALTYSGVGSYKGTNAATYSAALNAAKDGESTQLKKLAKMLKV